ncbi:MULTISPECIES: NADPH-dependent FMN reductase [Brevibacterium]|uniref:NADPH-dependent oxidoreductase n=1 Tax=Brevibacterium aurantiacum TaxID=273384 RepID=A0A4Z0KJI4_BREAU|nr:MULTISPECIES: NAD(P)H-dependent oxidoreductase [Brevibacterium]TGD12981.1 NADPH-dependent oxidoreductase [Brevibacterium sp. S111]TGD38884.1 NADPH-dependent oxidoreductase [Brevibacterium aurantiacum]
MTKIAVIVGSTRQHRRGRQVAEWVYEYGRTHSPVEVDFDLIDLADYSLPVLDEPYPAAWGIYQNDHTRRWAESIAAYDGYVFVIAEYNHGVPGALKNAIDYLYDEWTNKSAGFVSYGADGGVRAVEQMRTISAELGLADVREQVVLSTFTDFDYTESDLAHPATAGDFAPEARHVDDLSATLHSVVVWAEAMASVRVSISV